MMTLLVPLNERRSRVLHDGGHLKISFYPKRVSVEHFEVFRLIERFRGQSSLERMSGLSKSDRRRGECPSAPIILRLGTECFAFRTLVVFTVTRVVCLIDPFGVAPLLTQTLARILVAILIIMAVPAYLFLLFEYGTQDTPSAKPWITRWRDIQEIASVRTVPLKNNGINIMRPGCAQHAGNLKFGFLIAREGLWYSQSQRSLRHLTRARSFL